VDQIGPRAQPDGILWDRNHTGHSGLLAPCSR